MNDPNEVPLESQRHFSVDQEGTVTVQPFVVEWEMGEDGQSELSSLLEPVS